MLHRLIVIAVTLLSGFAGGQAAATKRRSAPSTAWQGKASGTHDGATEALNLKSSVFLNEVVSTSEAARLEVTFIDGTQVTLGEKAKLTLDRFVFNPAGAAERSSSGWSAPSGFSPARRRSWRVLTSA